MSYFPYDEQMVSSLAGDMERKAIMSIIFSYFVDIWTV